MSDRDLYDALRQHSQGMFTDYPTLLIFENQEQMDNIQTKNIQIFNKSRFMCCLREEITEEFLMRLKYSSHVLV